MPKDEEQKPVESEFFHILESMNRGRTLTALNQKLQELLDAVVETEGAGTFNVQLKIAWGKKNMNKVTATITSKLPNDAPEVATFFFDQRNRLVRDDPRQQKLPLDDGKVVKGPGAQSA